MRKQQAASKLTKEDLINGIRNAAQHASLYATPEQRARAVIAYLAGWLYEEPALADVLNALLHDESVSALPSAPAAVKESQHPLQPAHAGIDSLPEWDGVPRLLHALQQSDPPSTDADQAGLPEQKSAGLTQAPSTSPALPSFASSVSRPSVFPDKAEIIADVQSVQTPALPEA